MEDVVVSVRLIHGVQTLPRLREILVSSGDDVVSKSGNCDRESVLLSPHNHILSVTQETLGPEKREPNGAGQSEEIWSTECDKVPSRVKAPHCSKGCLFNLDHDKKLHSAGCPVPISTP
eukprot:1299873-Amorphochlora_amoeboformis.AAC.2